MSQSGYSLRNAISHRFTNHETVPECIKRIAVEQLDKAIVQTQTKTTRGDEAIHDVRVAKESACAATACTIEADE